MAVHADAFTGLLPWLADDSYTQMLQRMDRLEAHNFSAVTFAQTASTINVFLSFQVILDMQQEKAEATQDAQHWKTSSEAAWGNFVSLEARCSEVEGQLLAKSTEVHGLQQSSTQQSEVSARIHGPKSVLEMHAKLLSQEPAVSCVSVGCLLSLPSRFFLTTHHQTSPHLQPCFL